jgi:hypothetical protein
VISEQRSEGPDSDRGSRPRRSQPPSINPIRDCEGIARNHVTDVLDSFITARNKIAHTAETFQKLSYGIKLPGNPNRKLLLCRFLKYNLRLDVLPGFCISSDIFNKA